MVEYTEIQILLFKKEGQIFAQGLEIDICSWGKTEEIARERFMALLVSETTRRRKEGGSLADIGPPPEKFTKFADLNNLHRVIVIET